MSDDLRAVILRPNLASMFSTNQCNRRYQSSDPATYILIRFFPKSPTASSSEIRACNQQMLRRSTESSKTMADFKNLSYYDQLREIERQLVKLQDSYRRISSVPQSQPMDLISDLPANPPDFQSIEPIESIEDVLESPHTESTFFPSELSELDSQSANSAGPRVLDAPIEAHRISGAAKMSCNQGNQFGLFREKDPSMSRELLSSSFLLQKPNSSCHEAIEDSVPKADEDRQILYVSSMEDSSDFCKIDATIDTSNQAIVPGKVAQVGDGLFLDAHNLLEEMPLGDGSAKLQEMGGFEPLKVTSLPLLEVSDCEYENMSEWGSSG